MKSFSREHDLRISKTEDAIGLSFSRLLSEKELAKITVNDICTLARISRKTFYNHYMDIYDLFDQLCASIAEPFWIYLFEGDTDVCGHIDLYKFCYQHFTYDEKKKEGFYPLPKNHAAILQEVNRLLNERLQDNSARKTISLSPDMTIITNFISSGIIGVYDQWYASDRSVSLKDTADAVSNYLVSVSLPSL